MLRKYEQSSKGKLAIHEMFLERRIKFVLPTQSDEIFWKVGTPNLTVMVSKTSDCATHDFTLDQFFFQDPSYFLTTYSGLNVTNPQKVLKIFLFNTKIFIHWILSFSERPISQKRGSAEPNRFGQIDRRFGRTGSVKIGRRFGRTVRFGRWLSKIDFM